MPEEYITIKFSTGQPPVDAILREVVKIFETGLPELDKSYYLSGSYTNHTAVKLSDLDIFILVHGPLSASDDEKLEALKKEASLTLPSIRLDISIASRDFLTVQNYSLGLVMLKKGGQLLYGRDIRDSLPLPDLTGYLPGLLNRAYIFINWFHPDLSLATLLTYPDPAGEFFGYDYIRVPHWYPPEIASGTKELVAEVGWLVSALIALKLGRIVGLKEEAIKIYIIEEGGEFAGLVEEIYRKCKLEWGYLIPTTPGERTTLKSLCAQMPDFENHFLQQYKEYRASLTSNL